MRRLITFLAFAAFGMSTAGPSFADEPGQDHPQVNRYPGSVLKDYDQREFEEAQLILSKPHKVNGTYVADRLLPLEGAVTYLHYETPDTTSTLQVFRNYQTALKRSGFSELFVCERPCIDDNLSTMRALMKARDLYLNGSRENQYLAAQRGNTYVSLWVDKLGERGTDVFMFVIDKQGLDDGRIAVSGSGTIATALNTSGRADVYGFQFDTGKAVLRSESQPTLRELATVLLENPTLTIDIIGHTDDIGSAASNQTLSEARANAVVAALVNEQGIAANRLAASGKGSTQPVAPNTGEAGRAKNRRVEIVAHAAPAAAAVPRQTTATASGSTSSSGEQRTQKPQGSSGPTLNDANQVLDTVNKLKGLFGH
jgi:hypothetical protein